MKMFNDLAKNLLSGNEGQSDQAMNGIMDEFSKFLQESEGNEEMKSEISKLVSQIISKDSLYQPMKQLKDAYPTWLEENWESCSQEELEKYNKQLDIMTEICNSFEAN